MIAAGYAAFRYRLPQRGESVAQRAVTTPALTPHANNRGLWHFSLRPYRRTIAAQFEAPVKIAAQAPDALPSAPPQKRLPVSPSLRNQLAIIKAPIGPMRA